MNEIIFPVPRISEGFVDAVISDIGGRRLSDIYRIKEGELNADYVLQGSIIELKIIEEEGLEKQKRQDKIASLFEAHGIEGGEIDLRLDSVPETIRKGFEAIILGPIQGSVRKASKQIRQSKIALGMPSATGVLLIVNNGYSSLPAEYFDRFVVWSCRKDSSHINFAFCITVDHHQGSFDSFVFCSSHCHAIWPKSDWQHDEVLRHGVNERFRDAMTQVMRDQLNPASWCNVLQPVSDIVFDRNGVRYVHRAPEVPDSRFPPKVPF